MNVFELKAFRFGQLSQVIHQIYGKADLYEVDRNKYPSHVVDMFEIISLHESTVELRHLFDDRVFSKVNLPKEVWQLVDLGDVFLMALGKKAGKNSGWSALYISPPHETIFTGASTQECTDCFSDPATKLESLGAPFDNVLEFKTTNRND